MMLKECEYELLKEEAQDKQMRDLFGDKWTNVPSLTINAPYKQQITQYKQKIQAAQVQDQASLGRFNNEK